MAQGKYAIRESLAHFIEQRLVSKIEVGCKTSPSLMAYAPTFSKLENTLESSVSSGFQPGKSKILGPRNPENPGWPIQIQKPNLATWGCPCWGFSIWDEDRFDLGRPTGETKDFFAKRGRKIATILLLHLMEVSSLKVLSWQSPCLPSCRASYSTVNMVLEFLRKAGLQN
jgi:hypothetical protein